MTRSTTLALTIACALALPSPALAQSKGSSKQVVLPVQLPAVEPPPAPDAPRERVHRYRVSITGFVVEQQTWDDAMQRDGKDDEVFLLAEVRTIQMGGAGPQVSAPVTVRSIVMGDVQGFEPEDRLRAGQASDDGGLRTGDKVGTVGQRRGEPRNDRVPLLLWEGELYEGMAVMVVPTIWEWDGDVGNLERLGRNLLAPLDAAGAAGFDSMAGMPGKHIHGSQQFPQFVGTGEIRRYSETQLGRDVVGTNQVQAHSVVGARANRPIGMELAPDGLYRFDPWVITLAYGTAGSVAWGETGYGRGVYRLPYIDAPALNGRYQLHVQVEELGGE